MSDKRRHHQRASITLRIRSAGLRSTSPLVCGIFILSSSVKAYFCRSSPSFSSLPLLPPPPPLLSTGNQFFPSSLRSRLPPTLSNCRKIDPFAIGRHHRIISTTNLGMTLSEPSSDLSRMILDSPSAERNKGPIWDVLSNRVLPPLLFASCHRHRHRHRSPAPLGNSDDESLCVLEVAAGCGVHTVHFASRYLEGNDDNDNDNDNDNGKHNKEEETEEKCDGVAYGTGAALPKETTLRRHRRRPPLLWYPTDPDERCRSSIDARVRATQLSPGGCRDRVKSSIRPAAELILGEPGTEGVRDGIVTRTVANHDDTQTFSPLQSVLGLEGASVDGTVDLIVCINMIHIAPWSATLGLASCASAVLRPGGMLYCYGPYKVGGTAVESNLKFDRSLRMRDPEWGVRDLEDVVGVMKKVGLELVDTVEMPANNLSVIFYKKGFD